MSEPKDQNESACGGSALTAELGVCFPCIRVIGSDNVVKHAFPLDRMDSTGNWVATEALQKAIDASVMGDEVRLPGCTMLLRRQRP